MALEKDKQHKAKKKQTDHIKPLEGNHMFQIQKYQANESIQSI